jgi:adenylate cyclase
LERATIDAIIAWLVQEGLDGTPETELLNGFCARLQGGGLDLFRALLIVDTLHPIYEGRAFRWRADLDDQLPALEYGRTNQGGEAEANWQKSPFYVLYTTGQSELRQRVVDLAELEDQPQWTTMREEAEFDYIAFAHRFARKNVIGEMDCVYSHWTTRDPGGFSDRQLAALRELMPHLVLAVKCASVAQVAETVARVYLGRDAGQRVMQGRIERGVADRVAAVLWFSDLRGYTRISDEVEPDEIIPLLNDYAHLVISSVQESGGDVLKLIGDGVLAVFLSDTPAAAARCALRAEEALRGGLRALNTARREAQRPVTEVYLGLHVGEVLYGNIGSDDRLDFTVVGRAVNEVSRIASMCRSVDRPVVMSSEFAEVTDGEQRTRLVSVGRYALRGIGRAQELFTIAPELL